jgi:hypothetical protein
MTHGKTMRFAAFRFFNRSMYLIGEVVSANQHTIWVRIPKALTPKGRLIRHSNVVKRHIRKDGVLFGQPFTYLEDTSGENNQESNSA